MELIKASSSIINVSAIVAIGSVTGCFDFVSDNDKLVAFLITIAWTCTVVNFIIDIGELWIDKRI